MQVQNIHSEQHPTNAKFKEKVKRGNIDIKQFENVEYERHTRP